MPRECWDLNPGSRVRNQVLLTIVHCCPPPLPIWLILILTSFYFRPWGHFRCRWLLDLTSNPRKGISSFGLVSTLKIKFKWNFHFFETKILQILKTSKNCHNIWFHLQTRNYFTTDLLLFLVKWTRWKILFRVICTFSEMESIWFDKNMRLVGLNKKKTSWLATA